MGDPTRSIGPLLHDLLACPVPHDLVIEVPLTSGVVGDREVKGESGDDLELWQELRG